MSPSTDTRETRASAYEIKFVVHSALGETIAAWARQRVLPDPHATGNSQDEYRTTTSSRQAASGLEFTSQMFFDEALTDVVHAQAPYNTKGRRNTTNAADGI